MFPNRILNKNRLKLVLTWFDFFSVKFDCSILLSTKCSEAKKKSIELNYYVSNLLQIKFHSFDPLNFIANISRIFSLFKIPRFLLDREHCKHLTASPLPRSSSFSKLWSRGNIHIMEKKCTIAICFAISSVLKILCRHFFQYISDI